ncbi:MAG: LysR family transcriptional regulator [Myxococcota bacterium]
MNELDNLRAFVRVVDLGSFTAAARSLRVEQSTISKRVAALETHLGVRLLDRSTRALRATDVGRELHGRAQEALRAVENALGPGQGPLAGFLRISVPVVYGQRFVAPLLPGFMDAHPELSIELGFHDRYVSLIEEGFDLAIRIGQHPDSSLTARWLGSSRRHLVATPTYLSERGTPGRPEDLMDHECIRHVAGQEPWQLRGPEGEVRVPVRARVRAHHSEVALDLCRASLGVALLADWLVGPDLENGRLVELLPQYPSPEARILGLTPPGRGLSPRSSAFLQHLVDHGPSHRSSTGAD